MIIKSNKKILTLFFVMMTAILLVSAVSATDTTDATNTTTTIVHEKNVDQTPNNIIKEENKNYEKQVATTKTEDTTTNQDTTTETNDYTKQVTKTEKTIKEGFYDTGEITITASNTNPSVGESITITNTVFENYIYATNELILYANGNQIGTLPYKNTYNTATTTISFDTAGTYDVYAVYPDNGFLNEGTSNHLTITVGNGGSTTTKTATTTTLTASQTSITAGNTLNLTATVSPSAATGNIELFCNGVSEGTFTVSQKGGTVTLTDAGTYIFYARYLGDTNYNTSTSNTVTITVTASGNTTDKTATTTLLTASSTSLTVGDSSTITATVTPNSATGNISLYCNGQLLGTFNTSQTGGTLSYSNAGTYTYYAVYQGNDEYESSTSNTVTVTVDSTQTTKKSTVIEAEDTYMRIGSSKVLNFTLRDESGSVVADKQLSILIDGVTYVATTGSDGVARFNYSNYGYGETEDDDGWALAQGDYPVVISFNGDDGYEASVRTVTLTVAVRTWETTTIIEANVSSLEYGESFSVTPTVDPEFMLHPIDFSDYVEVVTLYVYRDGVLYGEYPAHPREYWIFDNFYPGTYTMHAYYKGSDILFPSTSNTITVIVNGEISSDSAITISASSTSVEVGDSVTLYTPVTPSDATGNVDLYCNGEVLYTYPASTGGGTLTLTEAGTYNFYAVYQGDATHPTATSNTITITAKQSGQQDTTQSTINIAASATSINAGNNVYITTTVLPSDATGSITLYVNGKQNQTFLLANGGISINLPTAGVYNFYATYNGDGNYQSATSNTVTVTATKQSTGKLSTTIEAEDTYMRIGSSKVLNFTLRDESGSVVADKQLSILIDGVTYVATTGSDGVARFNYSNYGYGETEDDDGWALAQGDYPVVISFNGDDGYEASVRTVTLTVAVRTWETTTIIEANVSSLEYGESFSVTPTVDPEFMLHPIDFSDYVEVVTLYVYRDGVLYGEYPAHPREYWIFDNFYPGTYTMHAYYKGSDILFPSTSNTITVVVNGDVETQDTTIDITATATSVEVGDSVTLYTPVTPSTATGEIELYCNNQLINTYSTSVGGGTLTLTEAGTYNFYAVYKGDATHNPATSKTITIYAKTDAPVTNTTSTITLSSDKSNINAGETIQLSTTVTPTDATGQISLYMNGVSYSNYTVDMGGIYVTLPKSGTYNFIAVYEGDENYDHASSNTVIVDVKSTGTTSYKLDTYIDANDTYIRVASDITLNFTLKDEDGRSLANKELYIYFNGETDGPYTTGADGVLRYDFTNWYEEGALVPGEYPMVISFNGDNQYNPSTKTINISSYPRYWETTTTLEATSYNLNYGESFNVTVLVDPEFMLYPLESTVFQEVVNIYIYKDGLLYDEISTHPYGLILVFDNYLPGTYTMYAYYKGSEVLHASTSNTITVVINPTSNKESSITMTASSTTVEVGDSVTINTPVTPSDATGRILLFRNGEFFGNYTTDAAGGTLTFTRPGTYTFYAVYEGDGVYANATSNTITIRVKTAEGEKETLGLDVYIGLETINVNQGFGVLVTPYAGTYTGNVTLSYVDPEGKVHNGSATLTNNGTIFRFSNGLTAKGTYTFYAHIDNDATYQTVYSNYITLTVTDEEEPAEEYTLTLEVWPDQVKYGRSISAIVRQSLSNATGTITFIVDGDDWLTYDASELLNAAPSIIFDKAGNITIQARYDGEDYATVYTDIENVEIIPLKSIIDTEDTVTIAKGDTKTLIIKLIDEDGYVIGQDEEGYDIGNQTIYITFNGNEYGPYKTDSEGIITFTIDTTSITAGSYPLKIRYDGGVWEGITVDQSADRQYQDYGHYGVNKTVTVIVSENTAVTINANNVNMKVYDKQTLNITVTDKNGQIDPDVTVTIKGENLPVTIKNNIATADLSTLEEGTYQATITYNPDETHLANTKTITIKVTKKEPTITLNNITNNKVGDKISITGVLTDEDGTLINGATVEIKIKNSDKTVDQKQTVTTNQKGVYTYTYTLNRTGSYEVKVEVDKNNTHEKAKAETTFTTTQNTATITLKTDKTTYNVGDKITITPTVTPSDVTGLVNLNINGTNVTVNANTPYTYTATKAGKLTITAQYTGDDKYLATSQATRTVTVANTTATIKLKTDKNTYTIGQTVTITPTVTPSNVTGKVTLTIDGKTITVNVNTAYKYVTDKEGKITITAKYNGDSTYPATSTVSKTVTVTKAASKITLNNITNTKVTNNAIIKGKLTDANGNAIANEVVTILIDDEEVDYAITDKNGNFNTTYATENVGKNTVKAVFDGNNKYNTTTNTTQFTVTKLSSKITVNAPTDTKSKTTITITGQLTDEKNNAISNAKVNITINDGQTNITATTTTTGQYTATYTTQKAATDNITVTYAGNKYTLASNNKTTVNVAKLNTTITVNKIIGTVGENITLIATITDENGNPLDGGKVNFKLNGLTLKTDGKFGSNAPSLVLTPVNGTVTYTLEAYLYLRRAQNVTAVFGGTSSHMDSRANAAAQIRLRNASTTVTTVSVAQQEKSVTFTAKIYDITNGQRTTLKEYDEDYVYFKVNSKTIRDENNQTYKAKVVNGTATVEYPIPNGMGGINVTTKEFKNYTVFAGYINPDFYPNAQNTTTFTIARANITFANESIVYNTKTKQLSIKATLQTVTGKNPVNGQNTMVVKINGQTYKDPTTGKSVSYVIQNGVVDLTLNMTTSNIKSVELVTGDRVAYEGTRNTFTTIKTQ